MTALFIVLGILLFFVLLFSFSITFYAEIEEEVRLSVGILGLRYRIFPEREKKEKKRKPEKAHRHRKEKELDESAEKLEEKPTEKTFGDTVSFILLLIRSVFPGVHAMLKHLRFTNVKIAMTVAQEEADRTAIAYGAVKGGVYTLLGAMDSLFTLKVSSVCILADFVTGESLYRISFKVKLRLCHILFGGLGMIFKILVNTIKSKMEESRNQEISSSDNT